MSGQTKIGILTGLTSEAKAMGKPSDNFSVLTSAANASRGKAKIDELINNGISVLGSIGVAGGLKSGLKPGSVIIATEVIHWLDSFPSSEAENRSIDPKYRVYEANKEWRSLISKKLGNDLSLAPILGVEKPVSEPLQKAAFNNLVGALAVDMESHLVAQAANDHGLPWFAVRIICDPAERRLPSAALAAIGSEREVSVARVFGGLIRRPADFVGLMGLAGETTIAMRSLKYHCRQLRELFDSSEI